MSFKYKHIIYISSITCLFTAWLTSCEIINPAEKIPAYIRIEKIDLSVSDTSSSGQGSRSHKITDAWIYVDDQIVGAFELPRTIPVLFEGNHKVTIKAGIKMNGIAATRTQYPFFSAFIQDVELTPGKVTTMTPVVSYHTSTIFDWIEDFEGSGFKINKSPHGTDTAMKTTTVTSEVFEGVKSGVVYLEASRPFFEGVSSTAFNIPKATSPTFLEMNYKCNQGFAVGVYASNSNNGLVSLYLNASPNWNKIYINLGDAINTIGYNPPFTFFVGMVKDADNPLPLLYLDNLKIIHQ